MPAALIWLIKGRYQPPVTAGYCFPGSFPERLLEGTSLALLQLIAEANGETRHPIALSAPKHN